MLPNRLNILIFSIAAASDLLQAVFAVLSVGFDSRVKDFRETLLLFTGRLKAS